MPISEYTFFISFRIGKVHGDLWWINVEYSFVQSEILECLLQRPGLQYVTHTSHEPAAQRSIHHSVIVRMG